jgi:hypothetical protein
MATLHALKPASIARTSLLYYVRAGALHGRKNTKDNKLKDDAVQIHSDKNAKDSDWLAIAALWFNKKTVPEEMT